MEEGDGNVATTTLAITVRYSGAHSPRSTSRREHTIKVFSRTSVSHVLKSVATYFSEVGYSTGDCDAYLLREGGQTNKPMNPRKKLVEYGVQNHDIIDLRRRDMPIVLAISISQDEPRKFEVSASTPVSSVVYQFCKSLGVENTKELSLAFPPSEKSTAIAASINWMDPNKSLNAQGVQDGDILLLRKKFFLFNEDIREAERNPLLRELLYNQLQNQRPTGDVPTASTPLSRSLCVGQDSDVSSFELMDEVMRALEASSVGSEEDKVKAIKELSRSQYHLSDYFPVKLDDGTSCFLCVQSRAICLTAEPHYSDDTKLVKYWDVEDVHSYEKFENGLNLVVKDTTYVLFSEFSSEIISYLSHMLSLIAPADSPSPSSSPSKMVPLVVSSSQSNSEKEEEETTVAANGAGAETVETKDEMIEEERMDEEEVKKEDSAELEAAIKQEKEGKAENESYERDDESQIEEDQKEQKGEEEERAMVQEGVVQVVSVPEVEQINTQVLIAQAPVEELPAENARKSASASLSSSVELDLSASSEPCDSLGRGKDAPVEDAGAFGTTGAVAAVPEIFPEMPTPPPDYDSLNTKKKRERKSSIFQPAYFGLDYKQLLRNYRLLYFVILDMDIRPLVVNIKKCVGDIVKEVCDSFCIEYPEEHFLRLSSALVDIVNKYGGKPRTQSGRFIRRPSSDTITNELKADRSLCEQIDFEIQPCVLVLKRRRFDEVDAVDRYNLDIGEEWPDSEDGGIAQYRRFFQNWIGVVQGACPVSKKTAVKLAGLLVQVYYGDRSTAAVWPPPDLDCRYFLPECYADDLGIEKDVLNAHKTHQNKSLLDVIQEVIDLCNENHANGMYFDVKVPMKNNKIMSVIPWKKMESRKFGLFRDKLVCATQSMNKCDLHQELCTVSYCETNSTTFRLNFLPDTDVEEYQTFTYQAKQIEEMVNVYFRHAYWRKRVDPEKKEANATPV